MGTKDTTEYVVRTIGDSPSASQSDGLEDAIQYIQDVGWIAPELVWIRKLTASQSMAHEAQRKEGKQKSTITLPTEFEKYQKVFDEATSTRLPAHKPWDHKIKLKKDFECKKAKPYGLSDQEDKVLTDWITDNLKKGYI